METGRDLHPWKAGIKPGFLSKVYAKGYSQNIKNRSRNTYRRAAMNFSSFTMSAANLRMPSAVFSVAMASSFNW